MPRNMIVRVLVGATVFAGLAMASVLVRPTPPATFTAKPSVVECRAQYARARTLADSVHADAYFPNYGTDLSGHSKGSLPRVLQCGDYRRAGLLGYRQGEVPLPPLGAPPARPTMSSSPR
jgi:hypothetical protein